MNDRELVAEVAERIYDAQHDACDDECGGGGLLWYQRVAARLLDATGVMAEIANRIQMFREDDELAGELDADGWRPALDCRIQALAMVGSDEETHRKILVDIAAVAAAEIEAIDHARTTSGTPS